MTMGHKQQVALFRYSVIVPLETGTSDPAISNHESFRQAAQKNYIGPDGMKATVGASTVPKCHHAYKNGGFEVLLPQSRKN